MKLLIKAIRTKKKEQEIEPEGPAPKPCDSAPDLG